MNYGEFINELNVLFPETTPEMAEKFRAMEGLYNDWNAKINVISRKDIGSLYVRHVLHSLAIAGYLKEARPEVCEEWTRGTGISVLDLGTGGGFPGIQIGRASCRERV